MDMSVSLALTLLTGLATTPVHGLFAWDRRLTHPKDLHICFTHPDFRRRAAGQMLMQWGCDLADALALPGYIEASKEGNFLYKTFGFEDRESIAWDDAGGEGVAMVREARKAGIAGGKAKP